MQGEIHTSKLSTSQMALMSVHTIDAEMSTHQ